MKEESVIAEMRKVLKLHLPKDGEAFLYGSRARGNARSDSDYDVLILLDKADLDLHFFKARESTAHGAS